MTTTAIKHNFHLPITTEDTLREFVRLAWGVSIPDVQVCANHSTPWRAFCDAYFARSPVVVWHGSRGFAGKSFLLALLGLTEAVTYGVDVNVLGGSGEQSRRVLDYIQRFWAYDNAPTYMLEGEARTETRLANGAKVTALMASQTSVRGPHPARLRLDEIDEMDLSILDAALGQPMSQRGVPAQTVMSSTRQYSDGTMTEVLRRAAAKNWPVHEWCWRETSKPHGWLPLEEIKRKRNEVSAQMWQTEYDLQEPAAGSRAIQPAAVERMFDRSLGEYEGNPNEYIEIERPDANGRYATGVDWARAQDWTVIATFRVDVNPALCVAWERTGRLDWPIMVAKFEERIRRYRGGSRYDKTGIGDVIGGYMKVGSDGVMMVGRERSELLSRYITACEHGEIVYPFIRFVYGEHKYASVEDVYSSGSSHHLPDSIAAGALGWSVYRRAGVVKIAEPRDALAGAAWMQRG
jgi:hypothetical protein